MMKQVFVRFHLRAATGFVSTVNVYITKDYQRFAKSIAVRVNGAVLERTLGFFHKQAQVFAAHKGYSQKKPAHKHHAAAVDDTAELRAACLCTQRAPSNIDTFPSAIVRPKQKSEDHSLGKNNPAVECPPSQPDPTSHPLIDTLTCGMSTSTEAEKKHLDSISCPSPLNCWASWNVLSPCCPGCAIFIPVQKLCSSTCQLHSETPRGWPADILWVGGRMHAVFSYGCTPLLMSSHCRN